MMRLTFPPVYPHEMEVSVVIAAMLIVSSLDLKPPSSDGKRLWP